MLRFLKTARQPRNRSLLHTKVHKACPPPQNQRTPLVFSLTLSEFWYLTLQEAEPLIAPAHTIMIAGSEILKIRGNSKLVLPMTARTRHTQIGANGLAIFEVPNGCTAKRTTMIEHDVRTIVADKMVQQS